MSSTKFLIENNSSSRQKIGENGSQKEGASLIELCFFKRSNPNPTTHSAGFNAPSASILLARNNIGSFVESGWDFNKIAISSFKTDKRCSSVESITMTSAAESWRHGIYMLRALDCPDTSIAKYCRLDLTNLVTSIPIVGIISIPFL